MPYRGPHMLTGSLPEDSHSKSSPLKQERGTSHFHWTFFLQWKQFLGKCAFPVTFVYCLTDQFENNNIESFCQKNSN